MKAYIIDAIRTPVGKRNGTLASVRPDDLFVHTIQSLLQRNPSVDKTAIEDVICGCAMPEGPQGLNVARVATLLAGLPDSCPAFTVNRFCASGLESVAIAAHRVQLGADLIIAGGTESMSQVPMMGNKISMNPKIMEDDYAAIAYGMGLTAEKVVEKYQVSREDQDAFALQSHQKASKANKTGQFEQELCPIYAPQTALKNNSLEHNNILVAKDQGPREDTSISALAKLKGAFAKGGSVTAGNSSQMSDGAAAVLIASETAVKRFNLTPVAEFSGYAVTGVAPEIMGIGPVAALPKLLQKTGISLQNIDWIELNEAFAAQSIAVMRELNLNPDIVNPLGGAIALGHPLGATGAIRTATLLSAIKRGKATNGIITMCIGTGMGAAGLIQAC